MSQYRLKAALGADRPADLDDVWVMKRNLHVNGYYELPDYGLTHIQTDNYSKLSRDIRSSTAWRSTG